MEATIRGLIEQIMDRELTYERLEKTISIYRQFKEEGFVDSIKSAVFGDFFNNMLHFVNYSYDQLG